MAALWDDEVPLRRTPRRRRRATVDGDDWAPPRRNAVNASALAGKRGALADGHYDALLTVGVRRDATVDNCTAALRQAAVSVGLDTIESESPGYVCASGVVLRAGDARCELQLCCVGSRRVAAVAVWLRVEINAPILNGDNIATQVRVARRGARNGDACARRVATAVRAVFADADLREADDAAPRRRPPSGAASDSEECGPGTGGLDAHFLGQLETAARDAAFAAHEHRAAWLGAAARRAERVAQQACAAMGFAAPEAASPPPPPPPKAVQPPPPTRRGCLRGAHAGVAARERELAAARAAAAVRIADEAAWRACADRVAATKEAVRESVERLRRNRRPVLRLARALVDEQPAVVVVRGGGVVVGNRDYGPVSRVRRLGDGALRVECRGGSFALRPASCSTDVVLAVLRALSSV